MEVGLVFYVCCLDIKIYQSKSVHSRIVSKPQKNKNKKMDTCSNCGLNNTRVFSETINSVIYKVHLGLNMVRVRRDMLSILVIKPIKYIKHQHTAVSVFLRVVEKFSLP